MQFFLHFQRRTYITLFSYRAVASVLSLEYEDASATRCSRPPPPPPSSSAGSARTRGSAKVNNKVSTKRFLLDNFTKRLKKFRISINKRFLPKKKIFSRNKKIRFFVDPAKLHLQSRLCYSVYRAFISFMLHKTF